MKKSWFSKDFVNFWQLFVKIPLDNKWFKVRKKFNYEAAEFLHNYKPFQDEIVEIRTRLKIPKLDPKEDYKAVNFRGLDIEDSEWILGKSDAFSDNYEEIIFGLLKKYNLPTSFHDWVDWYILYGKPKFTPSYNMEFFNTLINNPEEAKRVPLTTQEKKLAKFMVKNNFRNVQDSTIKAKQFLQLVKNSKNTRRPTRAKTAIKTLTVGKKGRTYGDLIVDEYTFEEESEIGSQRLKAKLRQQKHRLLQRFKTRT